MSPVQKYAPACWFAHRRPRNVPTPTSSEEVITQCLKYCKRRCHISGVPYPASPVPLTGEMAEALEKSRVRW